MNNSEFDSSTVGCCAWALLIFLGLGGIVLWKDGGIVIIIFAVGCFIGLKYIEGKDKEAEENKKKEIEKKIDTLAYKLIKLAQSYGYKTYNPTIVINDYFSIDENKKLFHYADDLSYPVMLRTENIISSRIEFETKIQNNAMKQGFADGILSGITGVGIIRDVDTLNEEVYTGKVILYINFRDKSGFIQEKKFYYNNIEKATKVKTAIDRLIFGF